MSKFKSTNVKRNTIEGEVLYWALEGGLDYWCSEMESEIREGKCYDKIYKRGAKKYHIINSNEVIEDMIYRLDEMLPNMEETPQSEIRACKRVIKKLKEIK